MSRAFKGSKESRARYSFLALVLPLHLPSEECPLKPWMNLWISPWYALQSLHRRGS